MGAGLFACLTLNACECLGFCACSLLMKAFNATLSQATRFGHFLILISVFVLALLLGNSKYAQELSILTNTMGNGGLTKLCDTLFTDICISRQLISRASASSFIFFLIMAIFSIWTEYINRSFWILKFLFTFGIFIGFIWLSNDYFTIWTEITRYLSFLWLLAQGLLLLDFAHDMHGTSK